MPQMCPNCSQANPDQSTFCVRCGSKLDAGNPASAQQSFENHSPYTGYSPSMSPASSSLASYGTPPATPSSASYSAPSAAPVAPIAPAANSWSSTGTIAPMQQPAQMGTTQGGASIRRAFAGRGTLVMHWSWLVKSKHIQASTMTSTILQKVQQRNIPGITVKPEQLMERGVLMEQRDYITINRSVSTVFTYVAPVGEDLYISRATTVLPAISNVRIIIYGFLLFVAFLGPVLVRGLFFSSSNGLIGAYASEIAGSIFSSLVSTPLFLFFFYILVRSIINYVVEKDFWWFLRPNTLNDFQLDDIAMLEHLTDDIVYTSVKEMGLDATKIQPPQQGYQPKRKLRIL